MIVFCTTCKGRTQHLEVTLPQNLADNKSSKFVILNYGDPGPLRKFLSGFEKERESGRLVVYVHPCEGPFRMAHAKNMAHRLAMREGGDILVNLDADNFAGRDFDRYVEEQDMSSNFLWAKMVKGEMTRGISGRIVVNKHMFLNAGGYDEQFHTWSPDDKDFNLRLQRLGYAGLEIPQDYLNSVLHNDKMRFKEYPHAKSSYGESQFEKVHDSEVTVANFGRLGCGRVRRSYSGESLDLLPLPTRIFGIGMHKTATTSLNAALRILGHDSVHWMSAHWAKAIWEEMMASGSFLDIREALRHF